MCVPSINADEMGCKSPFGEPDEPMDKNRMVLTAMPVLGPGLALLVSPGDPIGLYFAPHIFVQFGD